MTEKFSHSEIQKIIDTHNVVIFGKGEKGQPVCGFTARVQIIFEDLGADYEMINILSDPNLRAEMKVFSDWPTFPQVYIDGQFIGGCDIVEEMHRTGKFELSEEE